MYSSFILSLTVIFLHSAQGGFASEVRPLRPAVLTLSDTSLDGLVNKRQAANCLAPKFTCQRQFCCQSRDFTCCSTGVCCYPDTYCTVGDDGNMGCCDNGTICSGSAGPPISSTFTNTVPRSSTPTRGPVGSAPTLPSITLPNINSNRPAATNLLSSPLPIPGREMIQVSPTDSAVTYSPGHWTQVDSPCQAGVRAMRTTSARASFTYILSEGGQWGLDGYLNAHAVDSSWEVYANGNMIWPFSSRTATDCAFGDFLLFPNMVGAGLGKDTGPINFTVVVFPPGGSNNPFSPTNVPTMEFAFNELVLQKRKNLLGSGAVSFHRRSIPVIIGATSVATAVKLGGEMKQKHQHKRTTKFTWNDVVRIRTVK